MGRGTPRWPLLLILLASSALAPHLPLPLNEVQALEYLPTIQGTRITAPNRAHDFRAVWTEHGLELRARRSNEPLVTLATLGVGRGSTERTLAPVQPQLSDDLHRVEHRWNGLTEWFQNRPEGLEQGWTITTRPSGDGALHLSLRVSGPQPELSSTAARFEFPGGRTLRYDHFAAWDARGHAIPLSLHAHAGNTLRLELEDAAAEYPIEIDPLLASFWSVEPDQANAALGTSVAGAGDVNGDGYADVIVGAPDYDSGFTDEGRAFVYLGHASGMPTLGWSAVGGQAAARFGASVSTAGDVNRDGFSDVIVGSPDYSNVQTGEGRAWVYLGSSTGLQANAIWTGEADAVGAKFGAAVASAGDVNGDGYGDVVVGIPNSNVAAVEGGEARVYVGGPSGIEAIPYWTYAPGGAMGHVGAAVGTAGDVNGDGFSDLIVGAPDRGSGAGAAFGFLGSLSGPSDLPNWSPPSNAAKFGTTVGTAGDIDGDGRSDVFVGAPGTPSTTGVVSVYHGAASGFGSLNWMVPGSLGADFGRSVASAGDANGDGYSDLTIGSPLYSLGQLEEGRIDLQLGSSMGLGLFASSIESNVSSMHWGWAVSGVGDSNGDGFDDLAVGAPGYTNGESKEGRVTLFRAPAAGLGSSSVLTIDGNQPSALLGVQATSGGDVNGDGFSDVIYGATGYTNGESGEGAILVYFGGASTPLFAPDQIIEGNVAGAGFGNQVGALGDINGDGYGDVGVGASSYANGENFEGRVVVFYGSASGLVTTPGWTMESNNAGATMCSIQSAGDVNSDGYPDVIVGAFQYSNGESTEGKAWLYLGSATGLSNTSVWSYESNQATAQFGLSLTGLGDVNGDGFDDVLIGAAQWSGPEIREGRVLLFTGHAGGLSASPVWTYESNQAGAQAGSAVARVGDVNGDGFADALIAALSYDNGQINEGRIMFFRGSASGLELTPNLNYEVDQVSARFGGASGPGDVNGDGYPDLAMTASGFDNGQTDEGKIWVFHGGPMGPSQTANWSYEPNVAGAQLNAAGAALDFNGDGFSDLAVGAATWASPDTNEGRGLLFLGGDAARGRTRGLQQTIDGAPRGPGAHAVSSVQLSMLAVNNLATQLKPSVQFEVTQLGTGLMSWVRSPQVLPGTRASLAVGAGPGRYRWRARVVSGQEFGRWVSYGGNREDEADFVIEAPDAGVDAGLPDAGPVDAGTPDAGPVDAGIPDAGSPDSGTPDSGAPDAGPPDAGVMDAGAPDAAINTDAGPNDSGVTDAGDPTDAGSETDGGELPDAGDRLPKDYVVACGCQSGGEWAAMFLALALLRRVRRNVSG